MERNLLKNRLLSFSHTTNGSSIQTDASITDISVMGAFAAYHTLSSQLQDFTFLNTKDLFPVEASVLADFSSLRILLVGCGGLGCELLKLIAHLKT